MLALQAKSLSRPLYFYLFARFRYFPADNAKKLRRPWLNFVLSTSELEKPISDLSSDN